MGGAHSPAMVIGQCRRRKHRLRGLARVLPGFKPGNNPLRRAVSRPPGARLLSESFTGGNLSFPSTGSPASAEIGIYHPCDITAQEKCFQELALDLKEA